MSENFELAGELMHSLPDDVSRLARQAAPPPTPPEVERLAADPANWSGKYVRVEPIGDRAGQACRAWDLHHGRWVILKFPRPEDRSRFLIKARLAEGLRHPGLVPILDVVEGPERPFIAMADPGGEPLNELTLGPNEALEAVRDAATAVAYVHQQGIIHGELTPMNILRDGHGQVRVMDSGLARIFADRNDGAAVCYLSPEQAAGDRPDERSDVYALGATLYKLLTGRPPSSEESPPAPRRLNRTLNPGVEALVIQAMDRVPKRRYESVEAFARDLERAIAGRAVEARRPWVLTRWLRALRRRPRT